MAARSDRVPDRAHRGRILVVDDSPDNLEVLSTRLRFCGYEVETASRGEEALERVHERPPDLILLDVMLPGIDGYEVARRIKSDDALPFIPIILVTVRDTTRDKVAGLDAGADDYLTKPINFPELEARVRSMLRIKRLQEELQEKNLELAQLSISDGLTGRYNHRHVPQVLPEEFARAQATGGRGALVMFDLDRCKEGNDTSGHQVGDRVLQELAEILRRTAREIDKLGRYGGEEFIAVLPDTDLDDGAVFAERVRQDVARHLFPADGQVFRMTVSAGVAVYPDRDITEPQALVRRADQALYAAKAAGRNRVVRATETEGGPEG